MPSKTLIITRIGEPRTALIINILKMQAKQSHVTVIYCPLTPKFPTAMFITARQAFVHFYPIFQLVIIISINASRGVDVALIFAWSKRTNAGSFILAYFLQVSVLNMEYLYTRKYAFGLTLKIFKSNRYSLVERVSDKNFFSKNQNPNIPERD